MTCANIRGPSDNSGRLHVFHKSSLMPSFCLKKVVALVKCPAYSKILESMEGRLQHYESSSDKCGMQQLDNFAKLQVSTPDHQTQVRLEPGQILL